MNTEPEFGYLETNGIRLHVAQAGPAGAPTVILLHGFPEFWYGWRHQIGPLAEAGFRVVVPDQRGYNLSDKPKGIGSYTLDKIAADVAGLIDALGRDRVSVVGHDWGGVAAWWTAARYPDRLERVAILNAPHPAAMRHQLLRSPSQLLKSWYFFPLQIPAVPEALMKRNHWQPLVRTLQATSRPGTFSDEEIAHYRAAWSQPGAIKAMIHWYRAGLRGMLRARSQRIKVPVLVVHGLRDRFLGRQAIRSSLDLCDRAGYEVLEDATHWLQHEEPARVNQLLASFLSASPPTQPA
jgi:pimeloyl-ACP methyl ester carboxylesterase